VTCSMEDRIRQCPARGSPGTLSADAVTGLLPRQAPGTLLTAGLRWWRPRSSGGAPPSPAAAPVRSGRGCSGRWRQWGSAGNCQEHIPRRGGTGSKAAGVQAEPGQVDGFEPVLYRVVPSLPAVEPVTLAPGTAPRPRSNVRIRLLIRAPLRNRTVDLLLTIDRSEHRGCPMSS
jgi:hypothetical protein